MKTYNNPLLYNHLSLLACGILLLQTPAIIVDTCYCKEKAKNPKLKYTVPQIRVKHFPNTNL